MQNRNACRLLSQQEMDLYKGPKYYISHHELVKPELKSTPCRIVFNSSAKFKGSSLNDCYVKGPSMLNNSLDLLLRFCQERVAIGGDISKMYHSVDITLADQMTHRFLWRDLDETKKTQTYVMNVLNFGDRPSGSIAVAALQLTAKMSEAEFSKASKTITGNSYMDDILDSLEKEEDAEAMKKSVAKDLSRGGFKIQNGIPSRESKQNNITEKESYDSNERILGMLWDPLNDNFHFSAKLNFSTKNRKIHSLPNLKPHDVPDCIPGTLTKRMILSQINGIYNPRGLISPFTVRAKIMMRKLWTHEPKIVWDDPIPDKLLDEWKTDYHFQAKKFHW